MCVVDNQPKDWLIHGNIYIHILKKRKSFWIFFFFLYWHTPNCGFSTPTYQRKNFFFFFWSPELVVVFTSLFSFFSSLSGSVRERNTLPGPKKRGRGGRKGRKTSNKNKTDFLRGSMGNCSIFSGQHCIVVRDEKHGWREIRVWNRRGSSRDGSHSQGGQQARKLSNLDTQYFRNFLQS